MFVLPTLGVGGAESVMISLANHWAQVHNIYFLVGDDNGPFKDKIESKVNLISMREKRFSRCLIPLRKHFIKLKPDIIFSTLIYSNVITGIAKRLSGVPAILVLRESTTPSVHFKNTFDILKYLVGKVYKWADVIITGSKGVKDDLVANFGIDVDKIAVIKNPIISESIIKKSEEKANHPFLNQHEIPVILTVGKVTQVKDYTTLVQAFILLNKELRSKLLIVGPIVDNHLYEHLLDTIKHNGIEKDVDFLGFQPNPFAYMSNASCFVLTSKYEGSPGVLVQALRINGNVVSTNCPSGPSEILENGKYGRLVDVGNIEQLAEAMKQAIIQPFDFKTAPTLEEFGLETSARNYFETMNFSN